MKVILFLGGGYRIDWNVDKCMWRVMWIICRCMVINDKNYEFVWVYV